MLLDGGRVVAEGTHDELLATSARYREVLAQAEARPAARHRGRGCVDAPAPPGPFGIHPVDEKLSREEAERVLRRLRRMLRP